MDLRGTWIMRNCYSFSELIKTVYALAMTKLTVPGARLIRRPVYIRGKRSLGGCVGLTTGRFCRFDLEGRKKTLWIGQDCEFGDLTHIVAHDKVKIGSHVLAASKVFISDTSHGAYKGTNQASPSVIPGKRQYTVKAVIIGDNVWIGENAVILPGARIGSGSVIGANSVVTGSIPENCIAAGAPARVLKIWDKGRGWISANAGK